MRSGLCDCQDLVYRDLAYCGAYGDVPGGVEADAIGARDGGKVEGCKV